jgi:hypothetical protein
MFNFIFLAFFFDGTNLSLQPSFYPTEAESKGATPSQVGTFTKVLFCFQMLQLTAYSIDCVFSMALCLAL